MLHGRICILRVKNKDVHSKNFRSNKRLKVEDLLGRWGCISQHLWALLVADPPAEDVLRAGYHLLLGDLALCDPSWVRLPLILEGRVGPVLEMLDEMEAETDGHRGAGQPLCHELL
jgi:hypothetical protein